ncbi:PREDICTED: venom peptide HsVx1-like [Rhagoletis zephyria]|uniref:venom peptide HsVx1-like n=1 Tax=Rhagoletis zephyria TaxID=28612 RepID=UPI00081171A1|nr:PREDICTED: venom peptide HsVx1-like [Rhagoletis zephyria]XP_017491231.1 PREDICTED: venom peptide HsVx1-like [Rhagoletis zephyria]
MKCVGVFGSLLLVVFVASLGSAKADCEYGGQLAKSGAEFQIKGECNLYKCHEDGSITAKTCPYVVAPNYCKKIPQDDSKPYPACCETFDC